VIYDKIVKCLVLGENPIVQWILNPGRHLIIDELICNDTGRILPLALQNHYPSSAARM
jgi:hypothetical protein